MVSGMVKNPGYRDPTLGNLGRDYVLKEIHQRNLSVIGITIP